MKVSFIIPVYNAAKYLPRLIESLKAQKHSNWEALFTDDGSTDESPTVLAHAAESDPRIKIFFTPNKGASVARNESLRHVSGEIVAFVDSDDDIHPKYLEAVLPCFDDRDVDCVFFDYLRMQENGSAEFKSIVTPCVPEYCANAILRALKPWNPMAHTLWRVVYRKSLIDGLRFYPGIKHEDILYSYQAWGRVKKMAVLDVALYGYRCLPTSVTHASYSDDKVIANFTIIEELVRHYKNRPDILSLLKKALFPRMIKELWKNTARFSSNAASLQRFLDQYLLWAYRGGLICLGGFTLAKKTRLLLCIFKAWVDKGGLDITGRTKKLFLRMFARRVDYSRLHAKPWQHIPETVEKPVSVIVPVYNGYDAITRLTKTLFSNTDRRHTIVFIDDASPDVRIKPLLEGFVAENPNVRLMSNERNLGFAATVNKAIRATENDFVLLNTDTEVPQDWIPRLFAPIWNDPTTASVTPATCESHLLGVPTPETGTVQFVERHGVEAIDKAISRIKPDLENDVLVEGVGFCLAISRKAWDDVGPFAAEVFGRGYGEEADWCLRAHYGHDYENRFASNLFVAHWHGGSFTKEETLELQKRNNRLLALRNPRFGNDRYLQALAKRGRKELWALAVKSCKESNLI